MKKILVVEDEKDIREIFRKRFEKEGYEVKAASSGEEAISICKEFKPDLIVLDIVMPGMDGYETCKKLKEEVDIKNLKILFVTAKDLDPKGILQHCTEVGACGFINKLTDFKEISKKIKKILE